MSRTGLMAALLLGALASSGVAQDELYVVMQRSSEPGEAGEILVFVGEQLSYRSSDMSCENCWVFDSWHAARYRAIEWIHGVPPGAEIEFMVAEHAPLSPFGHSRYSLVFVERHDDQMQLVKYQQVPVYPTADGSFASCGPLWGRVTEADMPAGSEWPAPRDIDFSPRLVVDDARRLSAHGRERAHDPRWHEVVGDEVLCRRGIPVAELVAATVRRNDMLKVALPEFAGAAR